MTLQLIDADDFTREFYKSKMMPLSPAIVRVPPTYPTIVETIPPYNGFGSEEDSLQTCKHKLILSAPSKDGAKLKALANMIMRYEAVMAEPGVSDSFAPSLSHPSTFTASHPSIYYYLSQQMLTASSSSKCTWRMTPFR